MTTLEQGNKRLLALADLLDVADAAHRKAGEPTYAQVIVKHDCGTPACAWGHWIASPSRRARLRREVLAGPLFNSVDDLTNISHAALEFTLEDGPFSRDVRDIFGPIGCDDARTAKQAAKYIRRFVARRVKAAK